MCIGNNVGPIISCVCLYYALCHNCEMYEIGPHLWHKPE